MQRPSSAHWSTDGQKGLQLRLAAGVHGEQPVERFIGTLQLESRPPQLTIFDPGQSDPLPNG
ncbi:hypothetical protein [Synechococcus sp. MIT S9504]|uniref:hypothetical protein n=1 Tax=Synechococcus sp. MIT S9504 TaxID=1801628 RepID=UPI0039C1E065